MEHYWQECLRLPQRIQEWDAYKEMRDAIKNYLDVFPTLHKLNSKVGSFTWQAMFRKGKLRNTNERTNIERTKIVLHSKKIFTDIFTNFYHLSAVTYPST